MWYICIYMCFCLGAQKFLLASTIGKDDGYRMDFPSRRCHPFSVREVCVSLFHGNLRVPPQEIRPE